MNHHPTGYQIHERRSLAQYESGVMEGLIKSRAAVELAKSAIVASAKEMLDLADGLVNYELSNVRNTQDRVRAFVDSAAQEALIEAILQAIDDHYHLPLSLMSREANEE